MMFATIDLGTNTALLLIGKVVQGKIQVITDIAELPRIGEGLGSSSKISPEALTRTIEVLQNYRTICEQHGVTQVAAITTAAVRKAENRAAVLQAIQQETGFNFEMISGEEEAKLCYLSAAHDFGNNVLVLDIGGGSTEFMTMQKTLIAKSIPFGTVVLNESFLKKSPPSTEAIEELQKHLATQFAQNIHLETYQPQSRTFVATAGTPTSLAAVHLQLAEYDHNKVHGMKLSLKTIQDLNKRLSKMNLAELKQVSGLHPKRADVIVAGGVILEAAMRYLAYEEVTVSDHGLRYGLFLDRFVKAAP